jgi:ABC-type lipoprotein export system ATPase subunit
MFSWVLRGLMVNQFDSGQYDFPVFEKENGVNVTAGQAILIQFGFVDRNNEPFTFDWAFWGLLFALLWAILATLGSTFFLTHIRFATGKSLVTEQGDDEQDEPEEDGKVEIPFKRIDLTFRDVYYTVTSSISKEKLELLKGVDGVIARNRMTALMGSSGAGKSTLLDVLALRKSTGEVTGDIRLNGHPQDPNSFRRCTGYVEQFDTQSPQLTIRETLDFSARLRLDESDEAVTAETIRKFVDQALYMLELTNIQDLQVGSDATGGLSFEQRKRLSIAVEVVANPSILFLDEPTSGLVSGTDPCGGACFSASFLTSPLYL